MKKLPGRTAAKWDPVAIIEQFVGDELTPELAQKMVDWPENQRVDLAGRIHEAINRLGSGNPNEEELQSDLDCFGQLDASWFQESPMLSFPSDSLKQQLLYLPKIVLRDPIAGIFSRSGTPEMTVYPREARVVDSVLQLKSPWDWWLESLCEILPAIRQGYVSLYIPANGETAIEIIKQEDPLNVSSKPLNVCLSDTFHAFASDLQLSWNSNDAFELMGGSVWRKLNLNDPADIFHQLGNDVEKATEEEVKTALQCNLASAYDDALACQKIGKQIPWRSALAIAYFGLFREGLPSILVNSFASHLQLGVRSMFGSQSAESMMNLFGLHPFELKLRTSEKQRGGAQLLSRYRLPAIANVTIDDIIALRKNEESFAEFRRLLGDLLAQVDDIHPRDQTQFEIEFAQAMQDKMAPEIERLQSATKSSILEKAFVPAGLSLSGGALLVALGGAVAFPPAALVAAGLAPATLAADVLRKKFNKSGMKARELSNAYITLQKIAKK
jgi:hypothetical protein